MTSSLAIQIQQLWQTFEWLRPAWLWLLLPVVLLAWWHLHSLKNQHGWQGLIAPELLRAMLSNQQPTSAPRWPLLALALVCSVLALAGPSFSRQALNTLKLTDAVVVVLDLSPSMLAEDIKPSRLQAAHFKILDLLAERKEGYTALIAYSGSAHVVAPLSDDANTLAALVPSLTPTIMPSLGSRAEDAINEAITLLKNAQFSGGRIVLFTDEVVPEAAEKIARTMQENSHVELHIVAVGTEQGAPVPLNNGQFARDHAGNVVMNPLPWAALAKLAQQSGGQSYHLQQNPAAIDALAQPSLTHAANDNSDSNVDLPQDHGYLLLPLIALFTALAFVKPAYVLGSASVLLAIFLLMPQASWAETDTPNPSDSKWRDLWQTPDQQASRALEAGDAESAYQRFDNPQWKANAAYATGRFAEAEQLFSQDESAQGLYNTANAQAKQGKLAEAIANYERALEIDPSLHDAETNKALVEALLKQLQSEQEQQGEQQNDSNGQSDPAEQQDGQQDGQQNDQQSLQQQSEQQNQTPDQQQAQQSDSQENNQQPADAQQSSDGSSGDRADNNPSAAQQNTEQRDENQTDEQQQAEDNQSIAQRAAEAANETQEQQPSDEASAALNQTDSANEPDQPSHQENLVTSPADNSEQPTTEEQQALEQQLRRVPDDPAGLLRNKFNYYYQLDRHQRRQQSGQQEQPRW